MASKQQKKKTMIVDPTQISILLKSLEGSSVDEITITNDESSIHLVRDAVVKKNTAQVEIVESESVDIEESVKAPLESSEEMIDILSPEVGLFARAKDTKSPMLVKLRDEIKNGQTLAFIRSTGIMYEVKSTHSGKLVEILVEDGQSVEYAQPLFRLK